MEVGDKQTERQEDGWADTFINRNHHTLMVCLTNWVQIPTMWTIVTASGLVIMQEQGRCCKTTLSAHDVTEYLYHTGLPEAVMSQ